MCLDLVIPTSINGGMVGCTEGWETPLKSLNTNLATIKHAKSKQSGMSDWAWMDLDFGIFS